MSSINKDNFITVVSVGTENKATTPKNGNKHFTDFVTVLTISDDDENKNINDITEEVVVYRLPGERLGFGLKFEGGTKANEFVKRLFIQSCAPDSPASRVQSSWGQLIEGDEVLQIESTPVNTMTRIDCVRLLKDSNVAIKLLLRHYCDNRKLKSRSIEDLPVIISTEEKKPPPVPPRRIPKKHLKTLQKDGGHEQTIQENNKINRMQLLNNKSDREILNPPDAEVYVDLFSQESTLSLSESDDTGSSISTVLDRFGSFPTTTTSSFAGSLPSTPTSVQKQLDLSYIITDYEDEETNPRIINIPKPNREENNNIITSGEPLSFHDAPLSYGNENTDIFPENEIIESVKRPTIIPRSRDKIPQNNHKTNETTLPRLVDFVPKYYQKMDEESESNVDILTQFLENERFDFNPCDNYDEENEDITSMDTFGSKWMLPSHLDPIGEVEEEGILEVQNHQRLNHNAPIVVIETPECNGSHEMTEDAIDGNVEKETKELMEGPPIDFRQPPDGHEFPDFIETAASVRNFANHDDSPTVERRNNSKLESSKLLSSSNCDLRPKSHNSDEELKLLDHQFETKLSFHNRSQSLIDMSIYSKEKSSKWNTMIEQRKRSLSKLKGLVIPEQNESDVSPNMVIPEIRSTTPVISDIPKINNSSNVLANNVEHHNDTVKPSTLPLNSWFSNTTLPKYSPAFKRKSLQVYPKSNKNESSVYNNYLTTSKVNHEQVTPPKSLESISSPTRSDCSFDYNTNNSHKKYDKTDQNSSTDFKLDDESDNDSAVSSSQSSYISRLSPPLSPTRSCDIKYETSNYDKLNFQNRLLKPFSVEAINRKNILASAKCRSGKDIKIGSPVIQRKNEETESNNCTEKYGLLPNVTENFTKLNETIEEPKTEMTNKKFGSVTEQKEKHNRTEYSMEIQSKIKETNNKSFETYSASSILARRVKPINVKALKENFENASSPVFPKSFKPESKISKPTIVKKEANTIVKQNNTEQKIVISKNVPEINEDKNRINMINLTLDEVGSSLGITLAGGIDYEVKAITVHRIRYGSVAYRNGRLKKGDRILSINGKNTDGLTHCAAVELLKESCKEFRLETEQCSGTVSSTDVAKTSQSTFSRQSSTVKTPTKEAHIPNHHIKLIKDGGGLGFSIEGGKESPLGDVALTIKKIFTGGAADKCGQLKVGDEIIFLNDMDFTILTRVDAWSLMKKIPDGEVKIQIFR